MSPAHSNTRRGGKGFTGVRLNYKMVEMLTTIEKLHPNSRKLIQPQTPWNLKARKHL